MGLLFKYAREKMLEFLLCTVLAALGALLAIVPYALIYYIIQYFLKIGVAAEAGPVLKMIGFGFGAIVLRYLLVISSFVFSHIAAFDLLYIIRTRLTRHLGTLPMGYWSKNNSGKVRKVLQEDVEFIENFLAHHIPDMVSGFVLPIATIIFLFFIDWRMALAALIPLPIGLVIIKMMFSGSLGSGGNLKDGYRRYHDSLEQMHSATVEFVQGMPVVKAFNIVIDSFKKLKNSVLSYRKFILAISKGKSPYYAVFFAIILGGGVFILPVGIHLLQIGETDVATLILFLILGTGCFIEFVKVILISASMEMISEGARRIETILNEKPLSEPKSPRVPNKNNIELRKVSFRYNDDGPEVLKDINAQFPGGSFTAIVGPSGAGKTTLVHLMARMWDVTGGVISIDGVPIPEMGTAGINKAVDTVFQDVRMLTDTVENNIRMGKDGASPEDIKDAAKVAACHEFILSLPNGYATVIGEGGEVHLSGGEQQRIALARVVLKNPPVILLDEASSYADAENEEKMQEAFSRAMAGKTVVVIAHRLSTIVNADNILVVDNGEIKEQGSHDQLLEKDGLYNRMWASHTHARHWKLAKKEAVR